MATINGFFQPFFLERLERARRTERKEEGEVQEQDQVKEKILCATEGCKNEVANKRKILALASDEVLFEEKNLKFSLENSSDNFYGLKIEGDIESLATKYDIETLENSKASLQNQLNNLVAGHNIRYKNLEESQKQAAASNK